jgi:transmembrane sensor
MSDGIERGSESAIDHAAIEQQASDWLAARDRAGTWLESDETALQAWLSQSTRHRVAFLRLEASWRRMDRLQRRSDRDGVLYRLPSRGADPAPVARRSLRFASTGFGRIAACMALFAVLAGIAHVVMSRDDGQLHTTATGERAVISLADGTRITMNTSTRLRTKVTDTERHLWLDGGEAYFEVAHDASRPFVVESGDQRVRVLGTKFTLRREAGDLKAHVVEGRVEVTSASGDHVFLLAKDAVDASDAALSVHHSSEVEQESAMSWLQGKLLLDGMTLSQAAAEFNRYNGRKLVIKDGAAGSIVIGGVFEANNVDGFSRLLESGFGLQVQFGTNEIIVGSYPSQVSRNQQETINR